MCNWGLLAPVIGRRKGLSLSRMLLHSLAPYSTSVRAGKARRRASSSPARSANRLQPQRGRTQRLIWSSALAVANASSTQQSWLSAQGQACHSTCRTRQKSAPHSDSPEACGCGLHHRRNSGPLGLCHRQLSCALATACQRCQQGTSTSGKLALLRCRWKWQQDKPATSVDRHVDGSPREGLAANSIKHGGPAVSQSLFLCPPLPQSLCMANLAATPR